MELMINMNSDPGEGTSDGRVKRTRKCEFNLNDSDFTIKQEVTIKEEPGETAELVESSQTTSTLEIANRMEMEIEIDSESEHNLDYVKEEIKCGDKEGDKDGKKKSRENENENDQSNGSTNSNNDHRKRQQSNGEAKVSGKGRNRILTKKRNMAKPSKTRKVRPKPQNIHKCVQCNYNASYKSNLTQHIRIHTGEKPFECEICAKTFTRKSILIVHKKIHRSQFEFHCSKCGCGYTTEGDKINHENKCKLRQYECYLCKYSTMILGNLRKHMRIRHTGEKPFECSVCSKTFTTNSDLGSHLRVHSKQLPFHCQKCSRRFDDGNEKQLHEKRCNRRRFECYICGYGTIIKTNLKRHMCSKHTDDKQFHCSICDKRFVHKCHLKKHLASHAKQRPFRCSKCLRRFKDEDVKMTHEEHCNRRHYQCYLCKNNNQNLKDLNSHLQKYHVETI